jgi:hypothetical protein
MKITSFTILVMRHQLVCAIVKFTPKLFLNNCHCGELVAIRSPEKGLERSDNTVFDIQRLNISKPRMMEDQYPFIVFLLKRPQYLRRISKEVGHNLNKTTFLLDKVTRRKNEQRHQEQHILMLCVLPNNILSLEDILM